MRFHSRYPLLQLWADAWPMVNADSLAIARLEPVVGDSVSGGGILDLTFLQSDGVAVIPFVRIDPYSVVQRERTPMIWPRAVQGLGFDTLYRIEELVLPWLHSLALARQQNDEVVKFFAGDDVAATFEAAREASLLGAARYDHLMPAFAPYVYAARFSSERSVGIIDDRGANGAAMLASRAQLIRADLRSVGRNVLAERWFGLNVFGEVNEAFDVVVAGAEAAPEARAVQIALDASSTDARVVPVASSVPIDILVSFDPEDAPVARTFCVYSKLRHDLRPVTRAPIPPSTGGSSGSILLLMRDDFERAPNADAEEAALLASRLRGEGFSVEVRGSSNVPETYQPHLVHAFSVGDTTEALLRRLHQRGVPIVANVNLGPLPQETFWGPEVVAAVYARALDDAVLADHLELVRLRKLNTDVATPAPKPVSALSYIDVALVASEAERTHLRDVLAFRGEAVPYAATYSGDVPAAADIASVIGTRPFVFAHAPVDWRANIPALAAAAAEHGFPLVVAGPLVNFACLRYAAQLAPELVIHLPLPDERELDALYRSAHVYADVSWGPQGLQRIARAAASGCRLLLSQATWGHTVWKNAIAADPGSPKALAEGLERAWTAPSAAAPVTGADLFSAAIFAYSRAAAARQPA